MSEKKITLITLIVLGLILLGGAGAIWYLYFNVLAAEEEEITQLQSKVAQARRKQSQLKSLREMLDKLTKDAEEKAARIPSLDIEEYDRFANTIEGLKRQAGIFVWQAAHIEERRSVSRRGMAAGKRLPPQVHKVDYEFLCTGRFFPLLRFINLLETNQRFLEIQSCSISTWEEALQDDPRSDLREMKIKVTTYTYEVSAVPGGKKKEPEREKPAIPSTPPP